MTKTSTIFDMPLGGRSDRVSPVSIQKFSKINAETARVVVAYSGRPELSDLNIALAHAFTKDGAQTVSLAGGSAFVIDDSNGRVLADVVLKSNLRRVPYTKEAVAGMSCITANVFMDDENVTWSLRGDEGNQVLVQTASEDLTSVLQSRRSLAPRMDTASVGYELEEQARVGEIALVYDADSQEHVAGMVVANNIMVSLETSELIEFTPTETSAVFEVPEAVVASLRPFDAALAASGSEKSKDAMKAYLDYMKAYYSDFPDYFAELKKAVENFFNRKAIQA